MSRTNSGHLLPELDLWAQVPLNGLPPALTDALERQDWPVVKDGLRDVMDGVTADGIYGRALHHFVRKIPIGVDPVLDRYHAISAIDHGDWDDLRRCLASQPIEPMELVGMRDVLTAPVGRAQLPVAAKEHQNVFFSAYEFRLRLAMGRFRWWAKRMPDYAPEVVWSRQDVPAGRHTRYRRLQDVVMLAGAEALAGRLPVAIALSLEGQRLGDEGEALRHLAHDLVSLIRVGMGDQRDAELRLPGLLASSTGPSPLGTWELLLFTLPFLSLLPDSASFEWAAGLFERIAVRFGSPRAQVMAEAWLVASRILTKQRPDNSELPGLLARLGRASPGLRALPQLLDAVSSQRAPAFVEAEVLARRTGNVWLQVSALTWLMALNPTRGTAIALDRLLRITGWRRMVLVPPHVAGDAAIGLLHAGLRGPEVVELAAVAGRPNVTIDVATQHLDEGIASAAAQRAAVEALGKLGTARSRELLHRLTHRPGQIGSRARSILARASGKAILSEREIEVVDLVGRGLTNKEIAERLSLSQHTVARHVANARLKLGAANRAAAVSQLDGLREE